MKGLYKLISVQLLVCCTLLLIGCGEKDLTPEEIAEKYESEILNAAPVQFDYEITPPNKNLAEATKKFSGRWIGKWDDKSASQLIITNINKDEAKFIFSWGKKGQQRGGAISQTAMVKAKNRIEYTNNGETLTFVLDTLLNKIIGVRVIEDEVSNIVMRRVN